MATFYLGCLAHRGHAAQDPEVSRRPIVEGVVWSVLLTHYCRHSTIAAVPKTRRRIDLLQGTLDMLILRTLRLGPAHGHAIARHIQRTSDDVLQVETGSLYPALRRLEEKGWITAKWEMSQERNRELRVYLLTAAGRRQLTAEESKWDRLVAAIARLRQPVEEG